MTVMEYNIQFMRLSRYAPHLVATEQMPIQRFVDGLKSYLFRANAGHMDMTYEQALNRALTIERGNRDRGETSRDTHKRSHLEISHDAHQDLVGGGSRNDVGQRRRGQQGQRHLPTTQGSHTASSAHSRGTTHHQVPYVTTLNACATCGKSHTGLCRLMSTRCYQCGHMGHYARNCHTVSCHPSSS
jgi:hypothetical protein